MNWHVSHNFSRESGGHSAKGGTVRIASIRKSRFLGSWVVAGKDPPGFSGTGSPLSVERPTSRFSSPPSPYLVVQARRLRDRHYTASLLFSYPSCGPPYSQYISCPLSGRWVQVSVCPLLSCVVACQL